ncbi:MAG TPA: hypothetical protein VF148_00205 [Acidimicrobiia bacterium]
MRDDVEIKGGAGEFEAAVIAVIIDRIAREESAARQRRGDRGPGLPAWVRAVKPGDPRHPRGTVHPDRWTGLL